MSGVTGSIEGPQSEALNSLAQRIRTWRLREGKSYFSMPSHLWDEAIAAARLVGLRQASRALGLNREDLKRRMGPVQTDSPAPHSSSAQQALEEEAAFIELPGVAQALATPPVVARSPALEGTTAEDAVVEVTAADGARLTVRIPVAHLDLAFLVQHFRSEA